MSDRGPSALEIAQAQRELQLLDKMKNDPDRKWIRDFEYLRGVETTAYSLVAGAWLISILFILFYVIDWDDELGAVAGSFILYVACVTMLSVLVGGILLKPFMSRTSADVLDQYVQRMAADERRKDDQMIREFDLLKRGMTNIVSGGITVFGDVWYSALIAGNVSNSVVGIDNKNEVKDAMTTLAQAVSESGNGKAKEKLDDLEDAIKEAKPSKIESAWHGLVAVLPPVADLAKAAATITGLFK
jgi:hypothetical protein